MYQFTDFILQNTTALYIFSNTYIGKCIRFGEGVGIIPMNCTFIILNILFCFLSFLKSQLFFPINIMLQFVSFLISTCVFKKTCLLLTVISSLRIHVDFNACIKASKFIIFLSTITVLFLHCWHKYLTCLIIP